MESFDGLKCQKQKMESKEKHKKAVEIAEKLFTNGMDQKAKRLVLELESGADGGGWCKQAVIDLIADSL